MSRESIVAEVVAERERQDALWGGAEHDDKHSMGAWLVIVCRHLGLAAYDGSPDDVCHATEPTARADADRWRKEMIRVAAVAFAALESFDRQAALAEIEHLRAQVQRFADEHDEAAIAVPSGHPKAEYVERGGYITPLSLADKWEIKNALVTCQPNKNGRTA